MNPIILWIRDGIQRFGKKTPIFFKITGTISIVCAIIGAIPEILNSIGLIMPDWSLGIYAKAMIIAGIWGKIIAQFAVTDPSGLPLTTNSTNTQSSDNQK